MELEPPPSREHRMGSRHAAGGAAAGLFMLLASGTVDASCVSLTNGPSLTGGQLSLTCQTSNNVGDPPENTSTSLINLLNVPGTYYYGNSYNSATGPLAEAPDFGFYDDFVFTIGDAITNSITSTIDLGTLQISNLQVRLYGLGSSSVPTFGLPAGPVYNAWGTAISGPGYSGTYVVLEPTVLGAGTYVLEVRGNVTGNSGGSYSGVLNLTPVPMPGAVWLLGSALLGLAAMVRRRA